MCVHISAARCSKFQAIFLDDTGKTGGLGVMDSPAYESP